MSGGPPARSATPPPLSYSFSCTQVTNCSAGFPDPGQRSLADHDPLGHRPARRRRWGRAGEGRQDCPRTEIAVALSLAPSPITRRFAPSERWPDGRSDAPDGEFQACRLTIDPTLACDSSGSADVVRCRFSSPWKCPPRPGARPPMGEGSMPVDAYTRVHRGETKTPVKLAGRRRSSLRTPEPMRRQSPSRGTSWNAQPAAIKAKVHQPCGDIHEV
jgi:hypothetical protein